MTPSATESAHVKPECANNIGKVLILRSRNKLSGIVFFCLKQIKCIWQGWVFRGSPTAIQSVNPTSLPYGSSLKKLMRPNANSDYFLRNRITINFSMDYLFANKSEQQRNLRKSETGKDRDQ